MKRIYRLTIAVTVALAVLFSCVTGYAATVMKKIEVELNTLKVSINGKALANDNIVYKGNVYIRADKASEALGKTFTWDKKAKTVAIKDKPMPTPTPAPVIKHKIGDTVSYADWNFKVLSVDTYNTIGDYTAKGIFVAALVEFKNNAKMERRVGNSFVVKDNQDRVFSMSTDASLAFHQAFKTEAWYLDEIGSSFSAIVPLAFDVPKEAENLVLISKDNSSNPILLYEKPK